MASTVKEVELVSKAHTVPALPVDNLTIFSLGTNAGSEVGVEQVLLVQRPFFGRSFASASNIEARGS